ncbi:uncharacterized protein [Asterias amurensis]|uniref:uncharacterized protein n=1 Tax=Asterias amurensis TaxID=7602 RepID=UPI003AB8BBF3
MMLAFHLVVVLVHTAALAAAAGISSNAESELSLTAVSGLNPEETSRFVLQCDATTEGSQTVGILRGSQQISWNGQLTSDFVRSGTPPRFTLARYVPREGKTIDLLTIDTICATDEGTYTCNIYDKSDTDVSATSYVVVKSSSVDISVGGYDSSDLCQKDGEVTALNGDNPNMVCSWRSERASLSWTDGRTGLPVASVKTVAQGVSSAKINPAVTDDLEGATFQCSASVNVCSSTEVRTCTVGPITVVNEPRITVSSVKTHFEAGELAEFVCTMIPSVTSSSPVMSWHTVPPLGANRAYFSSTGLARMRLMQISEEDDGMVIHCTTYGRYSATGEYTVVVSSNFTGTNAIVDPIGDTVQTTPGSFPWNTTTTPGGLPEENTTSPTSKQPFILFGSYPITIAIISGGSVFAALLLALVVFCCCRGRRRHKAKPLPPNNRKLRLSPSTFGSGTPEHSVPGGGTDGHYMYATIFDPDEQWGATPGSTPSRATTVRVDEVAGYQQPKGVASTSTPPVYSQVGAPTFDSTPIYQETSLTSPNNSAKYFEISPPDGMVGNALYQSSGEYVDPEVTNQATVDKALPSIRAEKRQAAESRHAPTSPNSSGYLAIGEVPDAVRYGSSRDMNAKSAVYMEIIS